MVSLTILRQPMKRQHRQSIRYDRSKSEAALKPETGNVVEIENVMNGEVQGIETRI